MKEIKNLNKYEHLKKLLEVNNVILLSGNSTSGKTFIVDKIIKENKDVDKLKSLTTRAKRNAKDTDYIFVTKEEFNKQHNIYDLEYPENSGIHYSYTEEEIQRKLKSGKKLIIIVATSIIDKLKNYLDKNKIKYKTVFWYVSPKTLKQRYLERLNIISESDLPKTINDSKFGSKEDLEKRIKILKAEQKNMKNYDYVCSADKKIIFNNNTNNKGSIK